MVLLNLKLVERCRYLGSLQLPPSHEVSDSSFSLCQAKYDHEGGVNGGPKYRTKLSARMDLLYM